MKTLDKVVYQIYPKSFRDANGDGWGDIRGVIGKLDYIQKLGVDFIWFNPMTISPQNDNGYDVEDYCQIDSRYGTMEDVEELIKEADKRGIKIMFDMVFNHTSTHHVWFQKAIAGDPVYKDYYIFKKGKGEGVPPNNWQSKFGGPAWEYVPQLDEWYLHLFDVSQADLNWENPRVCEECADIVNFWYEKGIRGFRFDVINLISKGCFADDPNLFDGRQYYTDGPHVHEYLKRLNALSFGRYDDVMTVGEMGNTTIENCVQYAGADTGELDSVFSFHHLKVDYKDGNKWTLMPFDFMKLKELLFSWQTGMQEAGATNALFFNNHDQPRAISRFGNDKQYRKESGKMLAVVNMMMRGVPYVYYGEEIGLPNADFDSITQYRDVESLNRYAIMKEEGATEEDILAILNAKSRDNGRTPMPWSDDENCGFTTGTPWLPLAKRSGEITVEKDIADPDGIFATYKKLIALRHEMSIIQEGSFIPLLQEHPSVFAFARQWKEESMIVLCNFYAEETTVHAETEGYTLLYGNYEDVIVSDEMKLRPYESVVLYRKDVEAE